MKRHSVNNDTRMGLVTSICSNSNHLISLIPPQTASNFRHLLSCGTIAEINLSFAINLIHLKSFYSVTEVSIVGQLTVITMMTT